jgi:hypothetical protein
MVSQEARALNDWNALNGAQRLNDLNMSGLQAEIWKFLLDRFAGIDNAAPRATTLARYSPVHKKDISDRDFGETVSTLCRRLVERIS